MRNKTWQHVSATDAAYMAVQAATRVVKQTWHHLLMVCLSYEDGLSYAGTVLLPLNKLDIQVTALGTHGVVAADVHTLCRLSVVRTKES